MRKTLPDESGWYWYQGQVRPGSWDMAYVAADTEEVFLFGLQANGGWHAYRYPAERFPDDAEQAWYGPFACPGGDFGSHTIVMEESVHNDAADLGRAIVALHVDYLHCSDEKHRSNITTVGIMSRKDADAAIKDHAGRN